jgi:hypothetical protein
MVQGKGNLLQKTKWMIFDTYSSSFHEESAVFFAQRYLEFIMCLASSVVWVHLGTFPNWEFESFLQGLVQQNNQCLHNQFLVQ